MPLLIFIKGFFAGLLVCAPIGPVGVLALRYTITQGRAAGLASVLGGALADLVYCSLAGLSIAFLSTFLETEHAWIQSAAGLVLVFFGLHMYSGHSPERGPAKSRRLEKVKPKPGIWGAFWSSFFIMALNPMPILVFTVTFSALGVHGWRGDYLATSVLVAGVGAGSAAWAPVLVGAIRWYGSDFGQEKRKALGHASGLLLASLGMLLAVYAAIK
ncbi:MAG: LysE family transporter [Proteobacteria bacterium]|nr:LysE family transporter [Pseudomonadota bacterium]